MSIKNHYQLLDFGNGRKLEQFAEKRLDRPCPAATGEPQLEPSEWRLADWRYVKSGDRGRWRRRSGAEGGTVTEWPFDCGHFQLELKPTPFGHLGIFPEQAANWQRIYDAVSLSPSPIRVLNLFAYTGGSTLAAAAAGAHQVVHVDSARTTMQRARRNAEISSLSDAPIRWIVEDARRFVTRELKRGNHYELIVLDPPSYGHGPKAEPWKLTKDLMPLLEDCRRLLSAEPLMVILTCHSPGYGTADVGASLQQTMFGHCRGNAEVSALRLRTATGRSISAGVGAVARFR